MQSGGRVDDAFFIHHRSGWRGEASSTRPDPSYKVAGRANKHNIYGRLLQRLQLGVAQHQPLAAFALEVHLHPRLRAGTFEVEDGAFAE
jgi:hypothetical protein